MPTHAWGTNMTACAIIVDCISTAAIAHRANLLLGSLCRQSGMARSCSHVCRALCLWVLKQWLCLQMIALRNRPEKASVYDLLHQEASQINQKLEAKRAAKAAAQMEVSAATVLCWLLLCLRLDRERLIGGDFPGNAALACMVLPQLGRRHAHMLGLAAGPGCTACTRMDLSSVAVSMLVAWPAGWSMGSPGCQGQTQVRGCPRQTQVRGCPRQTQVGTICLQGLPDIFDTARILEGVSPTASSAAAHGPQHAAATSPCSKGACSPSQHSHAAPVCKTTAWFEFCLLMKAQQMDAILSSACHAVFHEACLPHLQHLSI